MPDLVVWAGPISASNLPLNSLPPGAELVTFNQGVGGIGSNAFGALGSSVGGSLRGLLATRGRNLDSYRTVTLAAYSAGWGLLESLLRGPEASRVSAVLAADAYYGANRKPGFVAFGERALKGDGLLALTTSAFGGPTYPSAAESVAVLVAPWDLQPASVPPPLPPAPARIRGGVLWANYADRFAHSEHGTKLAQAFMRQVVTPSLMRASVAPGVGANDAVAAAACAMLAAWAFLDSD